MKTLLATFTLLFTQFGFSQSNTTTYYLIRHAEKVDNSGNPDLSEIGLNRAQNWNKIFNNITFDGIYSTNYKRTVQTVTPLAQKNDKEIIIYDHKTIVIPQFKKDTSGKTVLIVGHSNTIPNIVNQLIDKKIYSDIEDNTFGDLFIVTVNGNSVTHQLLKLP
nr:histidine phosphatase family protein [uncultured Flavobacterium sp.]